MTQEARDSKQQPGAVVALLPRTTENIIKSASGNVIENATFRLANDADNPFSLEQDTRLRWARNQGYRREVNRQAAHHLHNVLVQVHQVLDYSRLRPRS